MSTAWTIATTTESGFLWIQPQNRDIAAETERQKQDAITNIGYHLTQKILDALRNNNYCGQNLSFVACWAAVESSLNPRAIGQNTAERERGLFQLMPSSAREIQPKVTIKQLYDPAVNTRIATTILSNLIGEFGSARTALVVYKQGRGNYAKHGETTNSTIYANGIIGCSTATWSVPMWR